MRRHQALMPLSDDHHQALVQARQLSLAGTAEASLSPTETAAAFLRFWTEAGEEHFRLEEEVLLPAYQRHIRSLAESGPHPICALPTPVMQVLVEHVYIRGLAAELADSFPDRTSLDLLHALGSALHDHIRLEERAVFPLIEQSLPEAVLAGLAGRLKSPSYLARRSESKPKDAGTLMPGISHERTYVVEPQHTAVAVHSGGITGLSTPTLLAWMESVAFELAEDRLPPGQSTVGVAVNLQHVAPTPVGAEVRVRATLTGIEGDGRRLNFSIEASDHMELIGKAEHQRFVIDRDRFDRRLARKSR
ncbi:MAG: hypothetical protein IMX00_08210 [Limnochordales bacterium]|nr:hypothetical protein [Limnochordales bacterium]